MKNTWIVQGVAALVIGIGLRFVVNLEPVWWLAWIVPGLLLVLALRSESNRVRWFVLAAALIGNSANFSYFAKVMPIAPALLVICAQSLLWMFVVMASRRIVRAFNGPWTVLAFPVLWVAVDTLLAHFTPDGNWGSLGYTQAEVLPIAQLASVAGVGGILFLLTLVSSALAMALTRGQPTPSAIAVYAVVAILLGGTIAFGSARLRAPTDGPAFSYGLISIDDGISPQATESWSNGIWSQYESHVAALAARGAKLIVLPEKVALLSTAEAGKRQHWLAQLAKQHQIWLVAGLGIDTGLERRNEAWMFDPQGSMNIGYLKHFMAPPEREFVPGKEFPVTAIRTVEFGVAICKDMHFASLGREFGRRKAGVMLVPAWDFHDDRFMAANMTKLRGVESGFAIVRSSRDGLLTVSDAYGRTLASAPSAPMPGATLLANLPLQAHVQTIYSRSGDALGWLCVVAALALSVLASRRKVQSP